MAINAMVSDLDNLKFEFPLEWRATFLPRCIPRKSGPETYIDKSNFLNTSL